MTLQPADTNELYTDISDIGYFRDLKPVKDVWEPWEWEDMEFIKYLMRGLTAVDGETGGGKSQYMSVVAWKGRKYYGQEVVCDAPDLLTKTFGRHEKINWDKVLFELEAMSKALKLPKSQIIADHLDELFKKVGVDLYRKTVIYDEAGGRINKRRLMGDVAQIVSKTVREWRHYGSLFMFASPDIKKTLDNQQVVDHCKTYVTCAYEPADKASYYTIKSKFFPGSRVLVIGDGRWWPLFNSFSRVTALPRDVTQEDM